jgi:hypothetical protein
MFMRAGINNIIMEDESDIYNYITKGILPSGKNRDILINKIASGEYNDILENAVQTKKNVEVICKNRKKNTIAAIIATTSAFILGTSYGTKKTEHKQKKLEK